MTRLTFYGGAGEIGGNKVLLEAENTRIFLDFGMSYSAEDLYFEFPLLRPSCIDDLFKTGILPRLCGLYKNGGLSISYSGEGVPDLCGEEESCSFDGVLLSHAHMDHYGYLGMLRPDIPVYLSPVTRKLIELRCYINDDWQTRVSMDALRPVEKGAGFDVGNLKVRRFDVDHSVLGASAYLIEAGDTVIAYTGDLRLHGGAGEATQEFMRACAAFGVDVLLCEGTRVGPPVEEEKEVEERVLHSEAEVESKVREIFSREEGLVVYDASPADMNRMKVVCDVAREYGRIPVFDSRKAYLLLYINHPEILCPGLPTVGEFKIALSRRKLGSRSAKLRDFPEDLFIEAYTDGRATYEDKLMVNQRRRLNASRKSRMGEDDWLELPDDTFIWGPVREEVLKEPGRYLIYTSSGAHTLLHFLPADGRKLGGVYIYGKAEPFKEEMEFSFRRLLKWIELCGLRLDYAHTSGHMRQDDLAELVADLDPPVLIPIHTEHPEVFADWANDVRVPAVGGVIEI